MTYDEYEAKEQGTASNRAETDEGAPQPRKFAYEPLGQTQRAQKMMTSSVWALAFASVFVGVAVVRKLQKRRLGAVITLPSEVALGAEFKGECVLPQHVSDSLLAATHFRGKGAAALVTSSLSNALSELRVDVEDQFQFNRAAKAIVTLLSSPVVLRNLLEAILSDKNHLEPNAATSHYHNNGFDKLVLISLPNSIKLRLHIWCVKLVW
jgi:hypothetical protein